MKNNENTAFTSLGEAIKDWAIRYRHLSIDYEHGAMIYRRESKEVTTYHIGKTIRGTKGSKVFRPNVVLAFLYFYGIESVFRWILHRDDIAAFIHTHPRPPLGYSYRRHSKEDLGLLKLKRIREVIVVPYENLEVNREAKSKPSA